MKVSFIRDECANVLLCAVCTIFVISLIAANVLLNCTARYNQASNQVRSWKEALYAAESGGDLAYNEVRKTVSDPTNAFSASNGWTTSGTTRTSGTTIFGTSNMRTSQTVNPFTGPNGTTWYRIRSKGTSLLQGLQRTGLDDRLSNGNRFIANASTRGDGDTLLRKIDFKYDHFTATYGPTGDGTNKAIVAVSPAPQLSRRIELIAAPVTPFEVAIKAGGNFNGLGSAAYIDSYRSSVGPYDPTVKDNPSDSRYVDSRSGSVQINKGVATIMGTIYGDVYTNGGTVTKKTTNLTGTIDNNVAFSLDNFSMPNTSSWNYVSTPTAVTGNTSITPTSAGTAAAPNYYLFSSFANNGKLTVNPAVVGGATQETYVAVHVTNDIGTSSGGGPTITIPDHVHLQVYFDGNFQTKADNIINGSGLAANLQFYAISPADPATVQTIDINSGGGSSVGFAAVFYAPSANLTVNGAPDIYGSVVSKNFYANGNIHWHYDRSLDTAGDATDYRIASYVEDIR
jgi:hypothetical protein